MANLAAIEGDYPAEVTSGRRDPSMDTIRFFAVILVVLFHFMAPITTRGGIIDRAYYATWMLRVPLLIFVAGWFSSAELPTRRSMTRLLQSIVVVYLLFELIERAQTYLNTGTFPMDWSLPSYGLWFLITVATLRLILPYLARVRWFGLVAVVASLLAGFIGNGEVFAVQRSIAFLPIFLLGWYARQSGLRERLKVPLIRSIALVVLLVSSAAGWLLVMTLNRRMVGMWSAYEGDVLVALGMRLVILAWSALVALAVLALVPRRRVPLASACGAGSMSAYLLHLLVQRQWGYWGGPEAVDGYLGVAVLALAAVALAIVLMLPAVRRPFRPLIQPRWEWFLRAAPEPRLTAEPLRTEPDRAARD